MFNKPPPDHVFGYTLPGDPEHAREGRCKAACEGTLANQMGTVQHMREHTVVMVCAARSTTAPTPHRPPLADTCVRISINFVLLSHVKEAWTLTV
eukprot:2099-Pelagomonas_calceolata.AAC.2